MSEANDLYEEEPTDVQWEFSKSQTEFFESDLSANLYVGGFRSGKTFVGVRKDIVKALQYPDALGLISANTVKQLHQSTLVELWAALRDDFGFVEGADYVFGRYPPQKWGAQSRFKNHDGIITFRWGAQVVTRSLSIYEPILGLSLGWAHVDEARDAKREAFNAVLSRLSDRNLPRPQLDITTTPNGFDWLYDYFEAEPATRPKLRQQRQYFRARTIDNIDNLAPDYIDMMQESFDERLAKQNLEGLWIDIFRGQAYHAFDRDLHLIDDLKYQNTLPVYLCCDFNVSPMSWLVCQPMKNTAGLIHPRGKIKLQKEVLCVIDEIVMQSSSTQEAIEEFKSRGYGEYPHSVIVFGDATGHHSTTLSDYTIIANAGYRDIRAPKANPGQKDRTNAVNGKMKNSKGEVGVLISSKCKELMADLTTVGFKPGTQRLDKTDPARTHTSDALGYCIVRLWPVSRKHKIKVRGERY